MESIPWVRCASGNVYSLLFIIIQVEETAGCSGDYLQFGRDTFIVTDRTSPKFCNKVLQKKQTKKEEEEKIEEKINTGACAAHAGGQ